MGKAPTEIMPSFGRRRWWHHIVSLGYVEMFDPPVHLDNRPDYALSPLRRLGETLDMAREARFAAALAGAMIAITGPLIGILMLWVVGYRGWGTPPRGTPPLWALGLSLVGIGSGIYVWNLKEAIPLVSGYWAERRVGEFLERQGGRVLHDLSCDGFNVDHVVLHRNGVYAIETKAARPRSGTRPAKISTERES